MLCHLFHPFLEGCCPHRESRAAVGADLDLLLVIIANLLKQANFKTCFTSHSENSAMGAISNIQVGQMRSLLWPSHL